MGYKQKHGKEAFIIVLRNLRREKTFGAIGNRLSDVGGRVGEKRKKEAICLELRKNISNFAVGNFVAEEGRWKTFLP